MEKTDYLDCLIRSGYLLESRLVETMSRNGFIVEPNVWLEDPRTQVKREIDAVAEVAPYGRPLRQRVRVKTFFIIEAVNNRYPLVLLTRREWTPNTEGFHYKHWVSPYTEPFATEVDYVKTYDFDGDVPLHSQYCTFTEKKGKRTELMAIHPEDLHSTFGKLTQYCSEQIHKWNSQRFEKGNWRVFYWRPILVLQNEIWTLEAGQDTNHNLKTVPYGKLEYHYADLSDPDSNSIGSIIIDIVPEQSLISFMKTIAREDDEIEERLFTFRQSDRSR